MLDFKIYGRRVEDFWFRNLGFLDMFEISGQQTGYLFLFQNIFIKHLIECIVLKTQEISIIKCFLIASDLPFGTIEREVFQSLAEASFSLDNPEYIS